MHIPPPPSPSDLLPPLLACLPTAFMSPQPPPALLPLLSPILRQRIQYMNPEPSTNNRGETWLPLLQWDRGLAAKLPDVVERIQPEPHPVSGELEIDELRPAKYRRLDEETLQARLEVEQYEILPIYVWCENDEHGQTGPGWKLAELRSLEDVEDGTIWSESILQANDAAERETNTHSLPVPHYTNGNGHATYSHQPPTTDEEEEEAYDDGSYWAAYDATPGRTPAKGPSPAPPQHQDQANNSNTSRQRTQSEQDYYNRYGAEVEPALDGHDPDEEVPAEVAVGGSTLNGGRLPNNTSSSGLGGERGMGQPPGRVETASRPQQRSLFPADADAERPHDSAVSTSLAQSQALLNGPSELPQPRAISPTTSHTSSVDRLEEAAAAMDTSHHNAGNGSGGDGGDDRALRGIKMHIATDIKSLFRLARSAGMERREFEEVVGRELSVLGMLEGDD
ncbi:hypothetical protein LTR78_009524 [Recurvomyces mirabilis]|uniref:Uncharacterized protein n=1 Tax=Recurvomyces mirabilis TaxID=574656 RepID=A0AAE0TRD1_9PEZI|nr:hypothetical protein LTR78_009524 [Recurvomyces mirabilis]KAK5150021.1 hypothetical protein LTS14_010493 [Recurvomyces mirabilis]